MTQFDVVAFPVHSGVGCAGVVVVVVMVVLLLLVAHVFLGIFVESQQGSRHTHASPVTPPCLRPDVEIHSFGALIRPFSQFQWVVYDCETRNVQLLEEFSPRPFFLKMYLPYFDMFAQGKV